jgi:Flp pilus assembly protein TadG
MDGGEPSAAGAVAPRASRVMALAARFRGDERGATAIILSIILTVILLGAAVAIDHGRHVTARLRQQAALDAALLAASDQLGLPEQDTAGPEKARAFYRANVGAGSASTVHSVTFDAANGEIDAVAGEDLATTLMRAFGYDTMKVGVTAKVARGSSSVEVALVLDNSGSMGAASATEAGTYLGDLKVAARNLVSVVYAGAEGSDKVKMSVVPFAASVNVGADNRAAAWIDGAADSSIHTENFAEARRRFDLFDALGVDWRGCVEARPAPLDVQDAPATGGDTLFVLMFAVDEPLMTDGENFLGATPNHNKSAYAAYGYAAKGRLGTTYTSSGYTAKLNERTRKACANTKSAGSRSSPSPSGSRTAPRRRLCCASAPRAVTRR